MGQPAELSETLRAGHPRAELKARLIVTYGIHPEQAAQLAASPEDAADQVERFITDLYRHLGQS
jgi:hypothetical protein